MTTGQNDSEAYASYINDRQADAWAEFVMTGEPKALAAYLRAEGKVDAHLRRVLIYILEKGPKRDNVGGKDLWRDYQTYLSIESITIKKELTKTAACKQYAEITNQTLRAVEKQFERGRKVYS